jgi:hypothetical protein
MKIVGDSMKGDPEAGSQKMKQEYAAALEAVRVAIRKKLDLGWQVTPSVQLIFGRSKPGLGRSADEIKSWYSPSEKLGRLSMHGLVGPTLQATVLIYLGAVVWALSGVLALVTQIRKAVGLAKEIQELRKLSLELSQQRARVTGVQLSTGNIDQLIKELSAVDEKVNRIFLQNSRNYSSSTLRAWEWREARLMPRENSRRGRQQRFETAKAYRDPREAYRSRVNPVSFRKFKPLIRQPLKQER